MLYVERSRDYRGNVIPYVDVFAEEGIDDEEGASYFGLADFRAIFGFLPCKGRRYAIDIQGFSIEDVTDG